MEELVIIERLAEVLNQKKVIAAVFYTFNFDAKFFENYLLPKFLPHVNFSDSEIQNSILWCKYANELPPVTVYCDFHAKSNDAPTLDYVIRTIDIITRNGKKPCFHPKNSFILLEDWTLIVITGSNNLSVGGWCQNIEGVSLFKMENGAYFPYQLKYAIKDFQLEIRNSFGYEISPAEIYLEEFLKQRKYTEHVDKSFYCSFNNEFFNLLKGIQRENGGSSFSRIEICSPYYSSGEEVVKTALSFSTDGQIYALTPYSGTFQVDITQETYLKFQELGILWSRLVKGTTEKVFRLNHSKIYRFKGDREMFTVIGSANFTEAGWKGDYNSGNIETAVVYRESVSKWLDWLVPHHDPDVQFASKNAEETSLNERWDVPDLQFTLDWSAKKILYNNLKRTNFQGKIMLTDKNYTIQVGKQIEISLNNSQLESLADNSSIKVHEFGTQRDFYFFPIHVNIAAKPYSSKLRLNDRELLELWQQVSINQKGKSEIAELLENFIMSRLDTEGELVEKIGASKSTMNMMASHINALIKLDERIFEEPNRVRDYKKAKELIDYYVFTNNIDTLYGYRNLLNRMLEEKAILPGVVWFLLNLLLLEFYNAKKVCKAYEKFNVTKDEIKKSKDKIEKIRSEINDELKILKKLIHPGELNENHYRWILNQIVN